MWNFKKIYMGIVVAGVVAGCSPQHNMGSGASSILPSSEETDLGKLSWNSPTVSGSGQAEMTYDLKVPYGRVYSGVSKIVKLLSPQMVCEALNKNQKYLPFETPCGKIVDSNWKEMAIIPVDAYEGVHSGYTVTMRNFDVPVWLSRSASQGKYTESTLDMKAEVEKMSSLKFAEDVSVRWNPQDTGAQMDMCMNIPGGTITAPRRDVFVRAKKKTWYGHFSTSTDLEVKWGEVSWQYGRACFRLQYFNVGDGFKAEDSLQILKAPYLHNAKYEKLNIRIGNWFLRLIDNIMSFFNASFRKALIKKVNQTVNQVLDKDIESGAWFGKVYTENAMKKHAGQIHNRIQRVVERSGSFLNNERIQDLIQDNCRLMKFSKSASWTERMQKFCNEVADSIQVSVTPVARDQKEAQAGCYDYYANIHSVKDSSGNKKWWAKQCNFRVRFTVKVSRDAVDQFEEIHDLVRHQIEEFRIPESWKTILDQNDLDEAALSLLLEEAEKRGLEELSDSELHQLVAEAKDLLL